MARIVGIGQSDGPVNAGERIVIETLATGLDDQFTIAPNLQVVHPGGQVDDVDVLVVGPFGVVVVEVKSLAGSVSVTERDMYVDGHPRRNPFVQTIAKARRIKSRLANNYLTERVWVSALVVFAQEPRSLQIPEDQADYFSLVENAVAALTDPGRWRSSGLDEAQRRAALTELELVARGRPSVTSLGPYTLGQMISETPWQRRYEATHSVLGAAHEVVHIGYDPRTRASAQGTAAIGAAYREALALQEVGPHPNIRAATDLLEEPDGSLVLVLPRAHGETLRELLDGEAFGTVDGERILDDVSAALAHIHGGGVAHRRVCPTTVEVDSDGKATLAGFGFARVPSKVGGTSHLELGLPAAETVFVAPEVFLPGEATTDADLFSFGMLAEELAVSELAGLSLGGLIAKRPEDRSPSITEVREAIEATAEPTPAAATAVSAYQVVKTLSETGIHTTEVAYNVVSGDQVVLRTFRGPDALDRARRVYRAMAAATHRSLEQPRTVTPTSDGGYRVVSSFAEGISVAEAVDTGTLGEDTLRVVVSIADGLRALHESGWAHGDVTSANVVLTPDGPVLIDFGIACRLDERPMGGTPAYRPRPGWIRSQSAANLDLFGLGIVAHEVLGGRRPEITERGLHATSDAPWSLAVAAALGLQDAPDCSSVEEFVRLLDEARRDDEEPSDALTAVEPSPTTTPETSDAGTTDEDFDDAPGGLYRRVDELIAAGRLDEAEQLCRPEWTHLLERITRARAKRSKDSEVVESDALVLAGIGVAPGGISRRELPSTLSGEHGVRSTITTFTAETDGIVARIEVIEADNGENWVTCTDVSGSTELYNAVVQRLRIGARLLSNDLATADLAIAVEDGGRWSARSATRSQIERTTGVSIDEFFADVRDIRIGTRLDLLRDSSTRQSYLCAVFNEDDVVTVLLRAFVLLRVVPVVTSLPHHEPADEPDSAPTAPEYPDDLAFDDPVGYDAEPTAIARRIADIVAHEGPMNVTRLLRSFRVQSHQGRVSRGRRAILVAAIERAVNDDLVVVRGSASNGESVLRTKTQDWVHLRQPGNRDLEEIPLDELVAALDLLREQNPDLGEDAAIDFLVRSFYGRDRVHPATIERVRTAHERLRTSEEIDGKYRPLGDFLDHQQGRSVTVEMSRIAAMVDGLPNVAYESKEWWANSYTQPQADAWMRRRWRVVDVNLTTQSIRFVR